jgi:hypothetical protein
MDLWRGFIEETPAAPLKWFTQDALEDQVAFKIRIDHF